MKVKVVLEREGQEKDLTPHVKDILKLLAGGACLTSIAFAPGLARLLPKEKRYSEYDDPEWQKFNKSLLNRELKRLKQQNDILIYYKNNIPFFKLTDTGSKKAIKHQLSEWTQNPIKKWDGRWRLIIYDIPNDKKEKREEIRRILLRMNLLQLQKSVYLTPFPVEQHIEKLREAFAVGDNLKVLIISGLEGEKAYLNYFGIKR